MEPILFQNRSEWRQWLESNYKKEKEVWLIFPLKDSGLKGITYNDSVEEALCFGWIDGKYRSFDEKSGARRYTPRISEKYSRPNIERLILMNRQNKIIPEIRESVLPLLTEEYSFPEDIIGELKKDPEVWRNYEKFSDSYKRIRVDYINCARNRPEEFERRLGNFISKTKKNKIIAGYGGIEKYY